jgi:uncharacterized protein
MNAFLVEQDTRRWLERAVIGLNLCPFAKAVHAKGQIHFCVSAAVEPTDLLAELKKQAVDLMATDAAVRDTTLLIAPLCLPEFLDFNDFLARADRVLADLGLDGILQLASFHPHFQFADAPADAISNFSNRSPYPTLHLLREDSIDRAVAVFPQASAIYEKNMQTLEVLGLEGWAALDVGCSIEGSGKIGP